MGRHARVVVIVVAGTVACVVLVLGDALVAELHATSALMAAIIAVIRTDSRRRIV